jgi:flagellin
MGGNSLQGLRVNTNIDSLIIQRALGLHTFEVNQATERLSTGLRINRPSDDAGGYVYGVKLNSQIRGASAAQRNINDGLSVLDNSDTALEVVMSNVQRIKELVVEALGGTSTQGELDAGQAEINELVGKITDLRTNAKHNGNNLLDGTYNRSVQTGYNDGDQYALDMTTGSWGGVNVDVTAFGSAAGDIGTLGYRSTKTLDDISIAGPLGAASLGGATNLAAGSDLTDLDQMIQNLSTMQASIAARRNRLSTDYNFLTDSTFNFSKAKSSVMDADIAAESSRLTVNQVLQQSAVSLLAQANSSPQLALSLIP